LDFKSGKCKLKEFNMMNFSTFNASAFLYFHANTRFDYKELNNGRVLLSRKSMELEIPKDVFEQRFSTME
jgi:hypothetical protein